MKNEECSDHKSTDEEREKIEQLMEESYKPPTKVVTETPKFGAEVLL